MIIQVDDWCTVHYTRQDFSASSEIGRLHKGLGTTVFIFDLFVFTFTRARVY